MKTQQGKKNTKVTKGYTVNPSLQGKYDNQPLLDAKDEHAKSLVEKYGVPKFPNRK